MGKGKGMLWVLVFFLIFYVSSMAQPAEEEVPVQPTEQVTDQQSENQTTEPRMDQPVQPPVEQSSSEEGAQPSETIEALPAEEQPAVSESVVVSTQPVEVPSMQPRKYTVQPGDTLWSISQSYLNDSFYWPKVWQANRFIKNPDLIYPGNVITLPLPGALERAAEVEPAPVQEPTSPPEEEAVAPEERVAMPPTPPPAPVEGVKAEVPMDPALLASVGFIVSGDIDGAGIVAAGKDNRFLLGEMDVVYIKPGRGVHPEPGDHLLVYRKIRKVHHPKTGKYLGRLVVVLGKVQIVEAAPKMITAKILNSYNYILPGDLVAPVEMVQLPGFETPSDGSSDVRGYVVDVKEEKVQIAQFDVVYIDQGRKSGIGRGSHFRVIREGERTAFFSPTGGSTLPSRVIAELEVIAASDHTATAKVKKSTEPILRGDRVETLMVR